ncbi:helix-turn-helix domain-containing protein [Algoriphagus resistens]|uniref:helix-turn-helix domain-containing protein n=1 Tax=Algoriphagus resistens TaxID=1750590 RepID=UPI000AEF8DD1|nr:AraC family transcriptional regulator [Algoriphagus resistens]
MGKNPVEEKQAGSMIYPKVYLYRRVVQAKLFIDSNYAGKIDLGNISDEAYFSKFHFIRLFKSAYGKTPHQYLKYVRIGKAKELLKNGVSVTEVCYSVGFESISSFSGLFSKTVGVSPSVYSAENKKIKEKIKKEPLAFVPGCYAYQHGWLENSIFEETGS